MTKLLNKKRDDDQVYSEKLCIRLTKEQMNNISVHAENNHCNKNEVVRIALIEYFNKRMSDHEIFFANLNEVNHRMYRIENKLRKYPAMIYALAEFAAEIISRLPDNGMNTGDFNNHIESFKKRVAKLSGNGSQGMFESILLDAIESQEEEAETEGD